MNTPSTQPKIIFVSLNTDANPAVRVDSDIWAKSRMVWVPDPDSETFTFEKMDFLKEDLEAPFKSLVVRDQEITLECPNVVMNVPNETWAYRITVRAGETEYSTDETLSPDGDRPVIRN